VFEGKVMILAMSRRIAADLYNEIINIKPRWHSVDLKKGVIKVVMTSASSDGPEISKHHTTKEQRRVLADRMKDPEDELKLVIVRDMWLTGFDVPCMHTLYIDKPMKGHNLMQAIARVNHSCCHDEKQGWDRNRCNFKFQPSEILMKLVYKFKRKFLTLQVE
jgi:type I restriction enzyme R subunit